MDPKVCGKLLTHHRRGYGVDVEALPDRIPIWQIARNRPRWDLRVEKVAAVEKWFRGSPGCFQGIRVYIGERSRSVELRGAHEGGGAPTPLGAPSCLVAASFLSWRPLQVSWIALVPKRPLPKVSFRLDSVWYSFPSIYWNRQKKIAIRLLGLRLVG